jgi:putative SOS response-associated peptidase YedK
VILREPNAPETWLAAPTEEAPKLQRPLPDWSLKIVARGEKEDGAKAA